MSLLRFFFCVLAYLPMMGYAYLDEDTRFMLGFLSLVLILFGLMGYLIYVAAETASLEARERRLWREGIEQRERESRHPGTGRES